MNDWPLRSPSHFLYSASPSTLLQMTCDLLILYCILAFKNIPPTNFCTLKLTCPRARANFQKRPCTSYKQRTNQAQVGRLPQLNLLACGLACTKPNFSYFQYPWIFQNKLFLIGSLQLIDLKLQFLIWPKANPIYCIFIEYQGLANQVSTLIWMKLQV